MNERLRNTIRSIRDWDELAIFQRNVAAKGALSDEILKAIEDKALDLGRAYIVEKTGLKLEGLSAAEERIIYACSEYVAVLRRRGRHPRRTLDQIRNHGLRGAAEAAVKGGRQSQGFQTLAEEDMQELSYEKIIADHPEEFSPRAVWYARRTLGLPNAQEKPPARNR